MLENERENQDMEPDLIELTDEEGNTTVFMVVDYFFYNGKEYAVLSEYDEEEAERDTDEPMEMDCFVMEVRSIKDENGEDLDEFSSIDDPELEEKLVEIATLRMDEDSEVDEDE